MSRRILDIPFARKAEHAAPGAATPGADANATSSSATGPAGADAGAAASDAAAALEASKWAERVSAALGDDAALLALARERAPLQARLSAVEAIQSEAALRQAETEFRSHDRRIHSLAKRRLTAVVALRQAREGAAAVLNAARIAAAAEHIAANELVELDRAWHALDTALIEPATHEAFAALMAQMAAASRERADQPQRRRRWAEQAQAALAQLEAAGVQAIGGDAEANPLPAAQAAAQAALDTAPADAAATHLELLRRGLELAQALVPRLALLDAWRQLPLPASADEPGQAEPPAPDTVDTVDTADKVDAATRADQSVRELEQRWAELEPLGRPAWDGPLQQRFAQEQESRARALAAHRSRLRELRRREASQTLTTALDQAEAALDGGQLAETREHLAAVDRLAGKSPLPPALRGRIDALQARFAQLKGWQQWAGSRARTELLQQAEALAAAVAPVAPVEAAPAATAAADLAPDAAPPAAAEPPVASTAEAVEAAETAEPNPSPVAAPDAGHAKAAGKPATKKQVAPKLGVKLSTHQLVEVITDLRARWKELDRVSGVANQSLWKRFDAALERAYQPVAAQLEAQRAAREQNLQDRERLLASLEAVPLPADDVAAAPAVWRSLAGRLEQAQAAWRKLGPVEHTVPPKARKAIAKRMEAAVHRLAEPLQAARHVARTERERLVAEAQSLAADASGRDLVPHSRDLQARWQRHAQTLPLARGDEAALWQAFKSAIDGAFAARQAAFDARHSQFKAFSAERQALIERLEGLDPATPGPALRRLLAEMDNQWQHLGPPAREDAAALEARWRRAREAAERHLGQSAQRQWHAMCDALQAKLALCEAREQPAEQPAEEPDATRAEGHDPAAETSLAERWSGWPALPEPLERALAECAGLAAAAAAASRLAASNDDLLLQLEAAWGMATPAAFEAARRMLKLQAMKAALESRRSAAAPATPAQQLAELLRRSGLDAAQRERLGAILSGLRLRGTLAPPR